MKAILCREFGGPEKLEIGELPDPEPGPGEVVIDVRAAALNFPDTLIIRGLYQFKPDLPFSPGSEASGTVAAVGEGVERYSVGDKVIATSIWGGLAEKMKVPEAMVTRLPASMDFPTGAAVSTTYTTALHALKDRADLRPGETLLVLGAAGGIGMAAVEVGRAMEARVVAAASTDEKVKTALKAGADAGINYSNEDLRTKARELAGPRGINVVFDPVGGTLTEPALRSLAWNGRLLIIGFASGEIPKIPMNLPLLKQCQIVGVFLGAWAAANPDAQRRNFTQLADWHREGRIAPLISEQLPFSRFAEGLEALEKRRARGKIVVNVAG